MRHIFLSFLFYNIILCLFYKHYKRGDYYIEKSDMYVYTILLIAFATLGTGEGDYLHYRENVSLFQSLIDVYNYNGMELHYNYLAYLVGGNYNLWRLVIFSVQFIGMGWLLYRAKLNTYPVYLCFIIICLILYTYQRSYWGVIFYFLGVYLLFEKRNPLFLIIIALCYFAHTQNTILLILLPLSFIKIRSWQFMILLAFLGTLITVFRDFISSIISSGGFDIENAEYVNAKVSSYGEGESNFFGSSIGEYLVFILRYVPDTLIILTWIKMIFTKSYNRIDKPYRGIINITIGLFISSLFFLISGVGVGIFFYRILSMTLFSVSLLLPYMVENKMLKKKSFNLYLSVGILLSEISYLKDLYYAYVHGVF